MSYLLGIDLGTTGLKCGIYNESGKLLAISRSTYPFIRPYPGWAEHDPNVWWSAAQQAIRQSIGESGVNVKKIKCVSQCGYHHCPILLDKDGQVLRNTITTHDTRITQSWEKLREEGILTEIQKITGSAVGTCHFPPIFQWIKENDRKSIKKCVYILMPKDFLRYKLTGRISTDICDATGTHLIEPLSLEWSDKLAQLIDVPLTCLPEIYESQDIIGEITPEAAKLTGLYPGTPVVAGGGDTHCALLGMGVVNKGQMGMMVGTSAVVRTCFGQFAPDKKGRCYIQRHVVPGIWCNAASIFSGSSSLEWTAHIFGLAEKDKVELSERDLYSRLFSLATQVSPGSEGMLFHPFLFGRRTPYYNPKARGTFFNVSYWHKTSHFLRSVLEGVAYAMRNCLEITREVQTYYGETSTELRAGGGGMKFSLWQHIFADILETEIQLTDQEEVGTLGAAMLAGVGSGIYKDIPDAVSRCVNLKDLVLPSSDNFAVYRSHYLIWQELYRRIEPLFSKIN